MTDLEMAGIRDVTVSYSFFPMSSEPAASFTETATAENRVLATQRIATFSADPNK